MFTRFLSVYLFLFFTNAIISQENLSLSYYLPKDITYNTNIPTPQSVLGYIPGKWHVSHDKLIQYMTVLADASPRITIENRGYTFEDRPLILLTITSEKNHTDLKNIQQQHIKLSEGNTTVSTDNLPAVVYQGFSIHGNEPSGSNAALLAAYYLAAAEGAEIENLLDSIVILFDPSLNPDGLQRFAYWANTNKSNNISTDPQDREYREVWPGGRTNHYWFDMNRDWLPVQLPESQARINTFHSWYPNIVTDHHEMGTNSTFFFQPGVQSRTHPLTPELNQKLTKEIANYHAKALDKVGSLYYSEENFDDFYYGKGSTFPDINGGIGILFEQGSSRGHAQESDNGIITFPFTIRNQLTTILSTLDAAKAMRKELLNYKLNFYQNVLKETTNDAYIFGNEKDAASTYHLAEILKKHKIELYELKDKEVNLQNKRFKKGYSYIVPKKQRQNKLLKAIFEKRTQFSDSLFYDVSAWTLPLAFNQDYIESIPSSYAGSKVDMLKFREVELPSKSNYAYIMEWHEYYTPKVLYQILNHGIRAKVGMQPFSLENKNYDYGTILIPVQNQKLNAEELFSLLKNLAKENHVDIQHVSTGLANGIDLGSRQFRPLSLPKIAVFTGRGITPYDAGEIWHLMDQRYDIPITKITTQDFRTIDISKYTHIILSNSQRQNLGKPDAKKLKDWMSTGGTLIGYRNALQFFKNQNLLPIELVTPKTEPKNINFEQKNDFFGALRIGGAIFEASIDRSHPINFGYKNKKIALFRNTTFFVKPDSANYKNPIQYTKTPLLSGYIHKNNLNTLANTVPFKHQKIGKGHIIIFTDNTNFRGFWYGTNKLLMNAIFFDGAM